MMLTHCGTQHRSEGAALRHCERLQRVEHDQPARQYTAGGGHSFDPRPPRVAFWRVVAPYAGRGWVCVGVTP